MTDNKPEWLVPMRCEYCKEIYRWVPSDSDKERLGDCEECQTDRAQKG